MSTLQSLLALLKENRNAYLSGQKIGEDLHVSRNAVWKAVEQLRSDGCDIESRVGLGYRLKGIPDILSAESIASDLRSPCILEVYDQVTSTLDIAEESPVQATPRYIVANSQSSGHGRLGRTFASPAGTGLYLTLSLKPDFPIDEAPYITMAAAVAVAHGIAQVCQVQADIKWVNDLYYQGKKVCGILTRAQTSLETGQIDRLLIGIGINCFPGKFPEDLLPVAGSLSESCGSFSRSALAAAVFNELIQALSALQTKDFLAEYRERCFILGKEIFVHPHLDQRSIKARALSIDDSGRLLVEYTEGKKCGQKEALSTGEVSIRVTEEKA